MIPPCYSFSEIFAPVDKPCIFPIGRWVGGFFLSSIVFPLFSMGLLRGLRIFSGLEKAHVRRLVGGELSQGAEDYSAVGRMIVGKSPRSRGSAVVYCHVILYDVDVLGGSSLGVLESRLMTVLVF